MRVQLSRRDPHGLALHPLWREAEARLLDRLSYVRIDPKSRFDHGIAQFGQAVHHPRASLDMIWSVGLLAYLSNLRTTLDYWVSALRPGGLLMFATLGPDSFRTLALALGDSAQERHVPGYPDMHDIGDALVALKINNPVMDAEWLSLSYSTPESALTDIRSLGGNPLSDRPQGLRAKSWRARVLEAIESLQVDGKISIPVELVFGHGWAGPAQTPEGEISQDQVQTIRWVGKTPKNLSSDI